MKVAVFAAYARMRPHFETELEIAQRHLDEGDEVTVVVCDGEMASCDANREHTLEGCIKCTGRRNAGLRLLQGPYRTMPFECLSAAEREERDRLPQTFADLDSLQAVQVENFDLGYAVVSSIVSHYRDPDLDVRAHADEIAGFLSASFTVYRSFRRLVVREGWDRVYVFNGRFAPLRAVLRACQAEGVTCVLHERGRDHEHYSLFFDHLPHDLDDAERRIRRAWDEGPPGDRERVAADWFQRRAAGAEQNWHSFVKDQDETRLPDDWNPQRHNVAVFPSSEDEYLAIGDSWGNDLYASQLEALQALVRSLEASGGETHLNVRMHPNLAGVQNRRTAELRELRSPCLTVIPADANISTYRLLRQSDAVLTFGSTVGIEAVFWGVPSILVGNCLYSRLGGTFNVRSHDQLVDLVRTALPPRDRSAAHMYGYYQATLGEPYRYFEADGVFGGRFRGKRVQLPLVDHARARLARWQRKSA